MRRFLLRMTMMVCLTNFAQAQQPVHSSQDSVRPVRPVAPKPVVKKPKPLRTEFSGGIRLNTNGWGLFVEKGWVKEKGERESDLFYSLKIAQIELSEINHPKEIRQTSDEQRGGSTDRIRPFVLGKVNNFYSLRLGYGFRNMIAGKPEPGNVSVHWFGTGGLALGLLKPYYIDAYVPTGGNQVKRDVIRYSDSTEEAFLNERLVIGRASFSKGLNELKIIPGLHVRTGLHFDFAPSKKTVLAISVGMNAEVYTQKIEIMARQKHVPYNFNLFAGFQFGKRW